MWSKKQKKAQMLESQKLQNSNKESQLLKQKTIKELIAPSRNRCIKYRPFRNSI